LKNNESIKELKKNVDKMAEEGMRTLVFGMKELD
jgi:magnesium-transporting ATPase (P-type)